MNACRASGPQYKYQVRAWPTPHSAIFRHSHALGPQRRQRPEHAATYGARPQPLCPRSTPSPRSLHPRRHSIVSPSTSTASLTACRHLRPWSMLSTSTALPGAHRCLQPLARHRPRPLHRCPRPCASPMPSTLRFARLRPSAPRRSSTRNL
jgi:hypothetical protein